MAPRSPTEAELVEKQRTEGAGILTGEHAGEVVIDHRVLHARQRYREHLHPSRPVRRAVDEAGAPHGELPRVSPPPLELDPAVVPVGLVAAGQIGAGEEAAAGELQIAG